MGSSTHPPAGPGCAVRPTRRGAVAAPSVAGMDTTTHRDRHHRRRPGRPGDRLPPAAARPPVRDPRRELPGRRQLAPAVGHAQALLACQVRRPARPAVPREEVVASRARTQVGDYLETYARTFDLPVRLETRVAEPRARTVTATASRPTAARWTCDNVVVATGTFGRTPNVPDVAAELDPSILQLHSSEYRRPGPAPRRPGARGRRQPLRLRHRLRGRRVATDDPGRPRLRQIPPRLDLAGDARDLPGAALRVAARPHPAYADRPQGDAGGPRATAARCCGSSGRTWPTAASSGSPAGSRRSATACPSSTATPREVATVVWATGFRQVFDWIHLPILGEDGWPREMRGVVADAPGLFFCGLSFQYAFSSMVLAGRRARRGVRRRPDRRPARATGAGAARSHRGRLIRRTLSVEVPHGVDREPRTDFERGDWGRVRRVVARPGSTRSRAAELEDFATAAGAARTPRRAGPRPAAGVPGIQDAGDLGRAVRVRLPARR